MDDAINIEELERLAKEATPGPWKACGTVEQVGGDCKDIIPTSVSCMTHCYGGSADRAEDQDLSFIAAANPAAVLSLIARLKSAEAERDALAAKLDELEGQEPVGWVFVDDPTVYATPGAGYQAGKECPSHAVMCEPRFARPAPAEPVNAQLLEAAKGVISWTNAGDRPSVRDEIETWRMTGVRVHALADLADAIVAADPSAKPELDRYNIKHATEKTALEVVGMLPEQRQQAAPKAVLLSRGEINRILWRDSRGHPGIGTPIVDKVEFARAIETAVLAKNGIEVAE